MKKYTLQICIIVFCIIVGVGLVSEINNKTSISEEINSFEEDLNNNEDSSVIEINSFDIYADTLKIMMQFVTAKDFDELLLMNSEIKKHYNNLMECTSLTLAKNLAEFVRENYLNKLEIKATDYDKSKFKKYPDALAAREYFLDLKKRIYPKSKDDSRKYLCKIIGVNFLKDFYIKWQHEKELNKSQCFDDMIRYVREAIIHDGLLKNKLKQKFTYSIIDEFQDTNQKQFDIFKSIFMEDTDHKIIVVGDPKQSIYSFQGADIEVYYKAKKEIENLGGEVCMLNTNYRSTEGIVTSCNRLFKYYDFSGTKFIDCGYLDKSTNNEYFDVKFEGNPIKSFWILSEKEEKNNSLDNIDDIEQDINNATKNKQASSYLSSFAKIVVQQIIECCSLDNNNIKYTKLRIKDKDIEKDRDKVKELEIDSDGFRNVSFKDFAVLARSKSEMKIVEKAFKKAGIPYLRYKDQNLFTGKECAHWIALLNSLITPDFTGRNRNILKKVLFTNFFGLTLKQINSEYVNKDNIEEVIKINNWKIIGQSRKWKELFDDILENSRLKDTSKSLKELQSLSIYKQIASYCIEFLSKGKSIEELIRTLTMLSKNGSSDTDDLNGSYIEKSTDFDCVQIMTMHSSKGLQFPVVICTGGLKATKSYDEIFTGHFKDDKDNDIVKLTLENTKENVNYTKEEAKRLYYVAYTRPQYLLMIPDTPMYKDDFAKSTLQAFIDEDKNGFKYQYDNNKSFDELSNETTKILEKAKEKVSETYDEKEKAEQLRILKDTKKEKSIYKNSYSSLSHGHVNDSEEDIEDEEDKERSVKATLSMFDKLGKSIVVSYDETKSPIICPLDYPRGTKIGTALHEIFEGLDFKNSSNNLKQRIDLRFEKQGIKLKDEWANYTIEMVDNVLNSLLPVIKGSNYNNEFIKLSYISLDNKLDEVEFNFNLLSTKFKNYCNGFVDLIFKNGDYYSIVDWKSDRLNDDFKNYHTLESLKKHVDESYSIQRVLYSYCLIKWLHQTMQNKSLEEIFKEHFGGVYYVFLRGCNKGTSNGVYAQTWESWSDLEKSFNEIIKAKVGGIKND